MNAPKPRYQVAALYIDEHGPYPALVEDWYSESRDARAYDGPLPVVAHPPCGPWGRLKFLCTKQDASCGPAAVASVQRFGGVLEHPADSALWRHCRLPRPGELPDERGGRSYAVHQCDFGHPCEKPTWLYMVGVPPERVVMPICKGVATMRVTNGPRGRQLARASALIARLTPPAFAMWLCELAELATGDA